MKPLSLLFALAALAAQAADPSATVTGITRDVASGTVTVSYTLSGADAIVTFGGDVSPADGQWQGLPATAFRRVAGDVNRVVSAGAARTVTWRPDPAVLAGAANGFRARLTLWSPAEPPDYMSAEIDGGKEIRYYASEATLPYPATDNYWKCARVLFRKIPAKDVVWNMASVSSGRRVRLGADFYLGVYEYTMAQCHSCESYSDYLGSAVAVDADPMLCPRHWAVYRNFRGWDPDAQSPHYPQAEGWNFATINAHLPFAVDFPTEAEWEYACRAGCGGGLYTGEEGTPENLRKIAWTAHDDSAIHEVGLKLPNAWGLYDMIGNVIEWCLDYWADASYFVDGTYDDPVGPAQAQQFEGTDPYRVARGGSYMQGAELCGGSNFRWGFFYTYGDAAFGVRFRTPIPGASAAKFEDRTRRWTSLDASVVNAYWDCTAYDNPAIIEATGEATDVDFRFGTQSVSAAIVPDGELETAFYTDGLSEGGNLNCRPPSGFSILFR